MIVEIKIPSPGESITEVEIANWFVQDGDFVEKDQEIAEIESDKATLPLIADASGKITINAEAETTVEVGATVCTINTEEKGSTAPKTAEKENTKKEEKEGKITDQKPEDTPISNKIKATPVAKKLMQEHGMTSEDVIKNLKRIGKKEVKMAIDTKNHLPEQSNDEVDITKGQKEFSREFKETKMSSLRRKLSQRLVTVKNETAMLTTFNEVDMSQVMQIRKKHQAQFKEKYGLKLGFMSFFTKAATEALKKHPSVNSQINGDNIITPKYTDIAIAVQTPKGLMVPVVKNTESLSIPEIELKIAELAEKARNNRISIEELTGGTFTITNGGVFGSMMSTPILNPPQSGILGMHNIIERPIAVNGRVEIRPMMYIALSYDHRVIDGKDSVGFLVKVKELIESPYKLLIQNDNIEKTLLGI